MIALWEEKSFIIVFYHFIHMIKPYLLLFQLHILLTGTDIYCNTDVLSKTRLFTLSTNLKNYDIP